MQVAFGSEPILVVRPDVSQVSDRLAQLYSCVSAVLGDGLTQETPEFIFTAESDDIDWLSTKPSQLHISLQACADLQSIDPSLPNEHYKAAAALTCLLAFHLANSSDALDAKQCRVVAKLLTAHACDERSELNLFECDRLDAALVHGAPDAARDAGELFCASYWASLAELAAGLTEDRPPLVTGSQADKFTAQRAWDRAGRMASMVEI